MRPLAALLLLAAPASAAVKSQVVEYDHAGTKCKGYLAYDDAAPGKRPGVLVFHEWWGLNADAKRRADMLAELGYVAFAADLYGDAKVTEHPDEAKKFADAVRTNEDRWLGRGRAAFKVLTTQSQVDPTKVAAIGYCFGGTTALQLALAGDDLKAVVAFHAGLPTVTPEKAKAVKGQILIAHGAADVFIKEDTITSFRAALDKAGTKYQFEAYPGATHSYTVPGIEKKMPQLKYDEAADKKSWADMKAVLADAFK